MPTQDKRSCGRVLLISLVLLAGCGGSDEPAPPPPAVNAGPDQTTTPGQPVTLQGDAPAAAPVTWQIVEQPPNSNPELVEQPDGSLVVVSDTPGQYIVEATTSDPTVQPDTVGWQFWHDRDDLFRMANLHMRRVEQAVRTTGGDDDTATEESQRLR